MADRIAEELEMQVLNLLQAGIKHEAIARITGLSMTTITRVAMRQGYARPRLSSYSDEVKRWLDENWHFGENVKKPKPRRKHSNFITPYNYPAM